MDVGKSITKAIDEMEAGDPESAMLHACNAIDGSAAKALPFIKGNNERFTTFLRDNYLILGSMGMPGINLQETRFPVEVERPKASGGKADLADIIYGIHRCTHGHGAALPAGFELRPDSAGTASLTTMSAEQGRVRLSDRIVFGLVAVAVLSSENVGESTPTEYYLTLGSEHQFVINEWWSRKSDFERIVMQLNLPSVKMDFGDWMT